MGKSASQKRREAKEKQRKARLRKELLNLSNSPPLTESSHEHKANDHAKQTTNHEPAPEGRSEGRSVSGFLFVVSSIIFTILLFIVGIFWQRRDAASVKIAFYWLIPASLVFAIVALSAYWYYVVKPANAAPNKANNERPFVFIKHVELDGPLAVGKVPSVMFVLANSGSMEAQVKIWDSGSYYEPTSRRGSAPTYSKTPEETLTLAPTAEATVRTKMPTLNLTAGEINLLTEGQAKLYFFARGEYRDELGRTWPFPFCRMYSPDFPGNVINCPKEFKIEG